MRSETDKQKLAAFIEALGNRTIGPGRIYLTGGATAVWYGWRTMIVGINLQADPEPSGFFEALAELKSALDINVELACPDQFIPALPGWRERSQFIERHGTIDFFHYDLYSQALAKIQRGHPRDLLDVSSMIKAGLVDRERLPSLFAQIESQLLRYPAIEPAAFRAAVEEFCRNYPEAG